MEDALMIRKSLPAYGAEWMSLVNLVNFSIYSEQKKTQMVVISSAVLERLKAP